MTAAIRLDSDLGVNAPIYFQLYKYPATFRVMFSGPVDARTFGLSVVEFDSCGYAAPAHGQKALWLSDREALITLTGPVRLGTHAITFGGGRDPSGREIQEPRFHFETSTEMPTRRIGAVDKAGQVRWLREINAPIDPVSISPDGRYALFKREIQANCACHTFTAIPYVLDMSTGELAPYPRATIRNIRWDLGRDAVWTNGTTYLDLSRPGVVVDLLDRLPDRSRQIADAVVSPDRRWLAALLGSTDELAMEGKAELVLVDLTTGAITSRRSPLGFVRHPYGSFPEALSWAPDSSSLLVTSYLSFAERLEGFNFLAEYFKASVPDLQLSRISGIGEAQGSGPALWAPAGDLIFAYPLGMLRTDGTVALKDPDVWPTGIWSSNGRFTLISDRSYGYEVLDLVTGARRPLGLKIDSSRPIYPQAISDDGETVYLGDRYGP